MNYYPNYIQNYQTTQQQQQPQQDQSAFITVQDEQQARNWPIAPGNSLTFKDEKEPYLYTKTMGMSQFDSPIFEKYRITKEEDAQTANIKGSLSNLEEQINEVKDAYRLLKNEIDEMKSWMRQPFMNSESR